MDVRHIRRRAFWIGFRSIWDFTGRRTSRELMALADEQRKRAREVNANPWYCGPTTMTTATPGSVVYRYTNT
jgi:hypothetical protein